MAQIPWQNYASADPPHFSFTHWFGGCIFKKMAYSNMSNLRGLGTNRKHLPFAVKMTSFLLPIKWVQLPNHLPFLSAVICSFLNGFFMSSSHTPVLLIHNQICKGFQPTPSFQIPAISLGATAINDRKPAAPKSFPSLQKSIWKDDDSMICRKISFDTVL